MFWWIVDKVVVDESVSDSRVFSVMRALARFQVELPEAGLGAQSPSYIYLLFVSNKIYRIIINYLNVIEWSGTRNQAQHLANSLDGT